MVGAKQLKPKQRGPWQQAPKFHCGCHWRAEWVSTLMDRTPATSRHAALRGCPGLVRMVSFVWLSCLYMVWFGHFMWFCLVFSLSLFLTVFHSIWSWLCAGNHAKLPARPQWAPANPANPQLHQRWAPPSSPALLIPPSVWWPATGGFLKYHLSFGN